MSRLSEAVHFLDGLSGLSRQQWLLRALVVLSPGLAFVAELRAGAASQVWVTVLLTVLVLLSVVLPDSHARWRWRC